jgi:GH15 family glucan-1,4-alpha-glucosidase
MNGLVKTEQCYLKNSAVLSTKLHDDKGECLEIIDCIPRFEMMEREFRPYMHIRQLIPVKGSPRVQIRLRPTFGYGWGAPEKTRGSNHVRFLLSNTTIRLTTNAPISFVVDEVLFEVTEPIYLLLMPDESLKQPIVEVSQNFLQKTLQHWHIWTKGLSIPFEWQEQVIRASIALKLSHFEETGAVMQAMTSSIPDAPKGHNYDARYTYLREAYMIAQTLNQLSVTTTLEGYLRFLSNIVAEFQAQEDAQERTLQPVWGISLETRLHERDMHRLPGYRGFGPVKLGSRDADRPQHLVYGSIIMALAQIFFDKRLQLCGDVILFRRLESLGSQAVKYFDQRDYGPSGKQPLAMIHTYSSIMCWAACDRLSRIAEQLKQADRARHWRSAANDIYRRIFDHCFNSVLNSFTNTWDGDEVDAFLLLLPQIGFLPARDPKFLSTLDKIEKDLKKGELILMNSRDPNPSMTCTYWYITILNQIGREKEARSLFENTLGLLNSSGLMGETVNPATKELWGNFPYVPGLVGLINCAGVLSKNWSGSF